MSSSSSFGLCVLVTLIGAARSEDDCAQRLGRAADDETSLLSIHHEMKSRIKANADSKLADVQEAEGRASDGMNLLRDLSETEQAQFLMAANEYATQKGSWSFETSENETAPDNKFDASKAMTFDTRIGDRSFTGASEMHTKIGPLHVHPFNLAVYFDDKSHLWGKKNTISDLKKNPHTATIVFKTTQVLPTWMPLMAIKAFMRSLVMPFVKEEHATDADVNALLDLQFGGRYAGRPPLGTITVVRMDQDGLDVNIAGQHAGRHNSTKITRAAVDMCVDSTSPVPGLSDKILKSLASGLGKVHQ
eukprot:gnl/TRDRNA2_/TRDRNA2_174354_c0_seq1.p1 gnl/TRDRNA2_/TRDRNA2_174354_c0~~gnl/TRDRNA2_/TRDRNA2_174354_c0_seq1.p1  ORF type:complete len:304 (-),score=48.12 gnl/TRDRNA2_/TRDRNA2_174354_c0_seq1:122-1033(-)